MLRLHVQVVIYSSLLNNKFFLIQELNHVFIISFLAPWGSFWVFEKAETLRRNCRQLQV